MAQNAIPTIKNIFGNKFGHAVAGSQCTIEVIGMRQI